MPIPDEIAAIHARKDLSDDDKRLQVYHVKSHSLLGVILDTMVGQTIEHEGFTFRINNAEVTKEHRLFLDVTFVRPPGGEVTHQITITNPPLLPRNRSGNEQEDMIAAIGEMLEGIV